MWCLNGTKRKNFCERHIHPHNVWGRSRVDTVLFIKLYIVDALCIKFNMCLNQQYSIWMHQSLSKAEGRTVKVNDCTGRYTKQAEGPGLTHTHTHTRVRMHACGHTHPSAVWRCQPRLMTGPLFTGQSHEGKVWAGQRSNASQHGRTAVRWEGPGPFITPVVLGLEPLFLSLSLSPSD